MNFYYAYGLQFESDLFCPELQPVSDPNAVPDVNIRMIPEEVDAPESDDGDPEFHVEAGRFRLTIPRIARYDVEQGKRIFIRPRGTASRDEIRLFLMGSAMGALLYQRGFLPLHGSAVETPWGAMVFAGQQGAGKSTLAAHLIRRGYRFLSDDICAMTRTSAGHQVVPAVSHLRLCEDVYRHLGKPTYARFHVDKYVVPIEGNSPTHSVPVRAIHILSEGPAPGPAFEVLRGFERIRQIFEHLYRPEFLHGQGTEQSLLQSAGQIAAETTMITASRPRDLMALEEFIDGLEAFWTKMFSPLAGKRRSA